MKSVIFNLKVRFYQVIAIAASVLVMTACGSTVANQPTINALSSNSLLTGATPSPTPDNGNIYDLPDAPTYVADINGVSGKFPSVTYSIATSRTLKVKVTPMGAPNLRLAGYTNWTFPYGCLRMRVTVNGVSQTTQILKVDGVSQASTSICANAPTYQTLDFSNDVTGNGAAVVVISNAEYDNCRYNSPLVYGCSMSAIFQSHEAEASVQIQGDGNYMSN